MIGDRREHLSVTMNAKWRRWSKIKCIREGGKETKIMKKKE